MCSRSLPGRADLDQVIRLLDFDVDISLVGGNLGKSNWSSLVATIHFSPFTRSFRRFFGCLFTVFFCNGNAKFTQSLLCSLFTKFTGECNHSHVHSLFTANGSSECSSIHMSGGDYQHRRKSLKNNRQTDLRKGGGRTMMRCKGFIPITNHANDHYYFLPFTANGSLICLLQSHSHIHSDHANCWIGWS